MVLNLGTQLIGLLLVLLVIFGTPKQLPTILGLATAGLTVVFQDFILAFCGWFVLMRRNGIRVGDWVEIDGVGGEVVDVGLLRTTLLETGNWTANGHPTGRRVSFLNGFAIHGKYFNFSTAGQWMWDEIEVSIPPGDQTYPLIEKIREATTKATEADAKMAEAEWKRVTHEEGSPQFSATPSVDLRPAGGGVDIVVRYVTRAGVRLETRNRLFRTVVELMMGVREVSEKRLAKRQSFRGWRFAHPWVVKGWLARCRASLVEQNNHARRFRYRRGAVYVLGSLPLWRLDQAACVNHCSIALSL
jgi:small-conductance mechanosensitive channel